MIKLNLKKKTKAKTNWANRTGTESQKWRSLGGLSVGKGRGRMGGKVQRIRSIIGRYKIDGKVKNSTGNEEIKEFICKTHGHELRGVGNAGGRGVQGGGEWRGEKNGTTDYCNSIINKIYLTYILIFCRLSLSGS